VNSLSLSLGPLIRLLAALASITTLLLLGLINLIH
jgi:hypothetical protein|tara:strand:- start:299 stop:403 length:105 start_codon:yes stop_codon:yes gene_type:complete